MKQFRPSSVARSARRCWDVARWVVAIAVISFGPSVLQAWHAWGHAYEGARWCGSEGRGHALAHHDDAVGTTHADTTHEHGPKNDSKTCPTCVLLFLSQHGVTGPTLAIVALPGCIPMVATPTPEDTPVQRGHSSSAPRGPPMA